jgi:hypothetical protein
MTFSLTDVIIYYNILTKLVLGSIGLILSGINLWGYYKCSKGIWYRIFKTKRLIEKDEGCEILLC